MMALHDKEELNSSARVAECQMSKPNHFPRATFHAPADHLVLLHNAAARRWLQVDRGMVVQLPRKSETTAELMV